MPRKKQAAAEVSEGGAETTVAGETDIVMAEEEAKPKAPKRAGRAVPSAEEKTGRPEHDPARMKALDTTLATLKKKYGEGTIMKLGEAPQLKVE